MSIQRPTAAPDPYTRPATVAYGAPHLAQTSYAPHVAQQSQQQWMQQTQQSQQQATGASYNPNQYPPMPGAAGQTVIQPQQQPQQQHQGQGYVQQGYGPIPGPQANQPATQQTQHQHRWSVAGQAPLHAQAYQQHPNVPSQYAGGSTNLQSPVEPSGTMGQAQAPLPPPKDHTYGQHTYQQISQQQQYPPPPASVPPQNYQYAPGTQLSQPQNQQYQYANPQTMPVYGQAPVPSRSPHQSFTTPPAPQNHSYAPQPPQTQAYGHHQQNSHSQFPQQWGSGSQAEQPQNVYQPYQQQQQVYSNNSQSTRPNEPVSPITAGRQNSTLPHDSRPASNHLPSRSNSNLSKQNQPGVIPHVQHIARQDSSPISAMKSSGSAFSPKVKVVDANGIGSTGPTALGMGGPSDWENFGPADFEVDDLDYYSGKQEPQGVTKVKEGKTDSEPVELPAASPIDDRGQQSWQSGAVEIDSGSPASTRPVSYSQNQSMHPDAQGQQVTGHRVGYPSANGQNMMPQNNESGNYHPIIASSHGQSHDAQHQASAPPAEPGSAWRPSPQMPPNSVSASQQYQPQQQYVQSQQGPPGALEIRGTAVGRPGSRTSWGASQQTQALIGQAGRTHDAPSGLGVSSQPAMNIHIPPAGVHGVLTSSLSPRSAGATQDELNTLQRKLTQTESELAQFKDREMESRLDGEKNSEQVQTLKNRIAKLEDECRMAQSECTKLENSLEAMENASVTASNERSTIEAHRDSLLGEKGTWERERADLGMKIGETEVALSKIKAEKSSLDVERTSLTAKVAESQAFMATVQSERLNWDAERVDLTTKLRDADATLTNTKVEAGATRLELLAKVTAAEEALSAIKNDAEATSKGYQAKLKEAADLTAQTQSELDAVKKQLEELKTQPIDIAPGLGDWYKGSLARFAEILFGEEAAASVPDKMRIFQDWVNSEAQLRGIEMQFQPRIGTNATAPSVGPSTIHTNTKNTERGISPAAPQIQTDSAEHPATTDDIQYSPGGRPVMRRTVTDTRSVSDVSITSQSEVPSISVVQSEKKAFRAYRADSTPSLGPESRSNSVPAVEKAAPAIAGKDSLPVAKPLAYQKPKFVKPLGDKSTHALKSATSVPLLASAVKSGSALPKDEIFLHNPTSADKPKSTKAVADAVLPPVLKPKTPDPFEQSPAESSKSQPVNVPAVTAKPARKSLKLPPLEQLKDILPRVAMPSIPMSHPQITPVNNALSSFTETDFSFIANISRQWEASAAEKRKWLDTERSRRQAEAEERSSQLFQDGAIGYKDITEIEGTNKEKELDRQEQETNEEWSSYLKDVFGTTFERLQKEIGELIQVRSNVDKLCQIGSAGQQALDAAARPDAPDSAVTLADSLNLLIRVHTLLVAREVEADKLVVERDRRYKKNITRSLYRKGQIKKMKEQETHFERLERKSEVERRHERLKNCGLLMKDVKAAVGRGCDDNEAFAAEMLAIIRKVALDDSLASHKSEVQATLRRANDVLSELAQSSTALMRHYERVDGLLNEAEYEHQVAVERASDAAPSVFHELQAQKQEQDRLLTVEARQRESAVDKTLQDWRAELGKITGVMGLDEASVGGASSSSGSGGGAAAAAEGDEEKKRRLQAALENAKRRNGDL